LPLFVMFYVVIELLLGPPLDVLIDSENGLPPGYDPGLNAQAVLAIEGLQDAANDQGITITVNSGYRSFAYQAEVYARENAEPGSDVSLFSALPGHSEHQLGTAFDVVWPGVVMGASDPRNDLLYAWLEENAHRFGFVLSYPYKRGDVWPYSNRFMPLVTAYIYEPWHLRFVGVELATSIFDSGYTDPNSPVLPQDFYQVWP
jgi:D-alanyl-D-alanine carboxypeptidase